LKKYEFKIVKGEEFFTVVRIGLPDGTDAPRAWEVVCSYIVERRAIEMVKLMSKVQEGEL